MADLTLAGVSKAYGRTEVLLVDSPAHPGDLLLLRVTDAAHNVVTFDLSDRSMPR